MLDDSYAEFMVRRKTPAAYKVLKVALIIFASLLVAVSVLTIQLTYSIGFLVAVAIAVGIVFLIKSFNVEYEYIVSGDELSIDKITDQSRRKTVMTIEMGKVELIADYKDHNLDGFKSNPNTKVYDFSSREEDHQKYAIVYTDPDKKGLYLFEPNEKMLKCLKNSAPRKVIISA